MSGKRKFQMIRIRPFKEKEGGERRSQLSGQWKEKEKVPVLGGQWKEKEKHLFTLSPQETLFRLSFFPLILRFYFYHGFRLLFMHFLPFFWPINYNRAFRCHKSPTHSLPIWHYHWLCGPIRRLPFNSKADYLIRIIWCTLNFLQLWTIIVA
jgi:hypothetical protein